MESATGESKGSGELGRSLLFVCVGCFYWITLTPFVDLRLDPAGAKPTWWSQVIIVGIFLILLAFAAREPVRQMVARPRLLLGLVFGWLLLTSALGDDPLNAVRHVAIAITVCISASTFLMLPKTEREFARLLGSVVLLVLGLCYFGVIVLPVLSIHQASDFLQPTFPGLWRGIYVQKNEAAAAMVVACFVGLYVRTAWSKPVGLLIIAAAGFFLLHTGSKTSMAMLPAILVAGYAFERLRPLRAAVVFGGVGLLNMATVGVAMFKPVRDLVAMVGIDPTYTSRSDIWQLALHAIAERPLTGHGFQSFWQTKSLVNSDEGAFTWAVSAVDAHNAYLDAAVTAGIPGLVLMIVWVLVTPLRDVDAADAADNYTALTRLFTRIWLFGIFLASLESAFLVNSGPIWFTMLMAMFGLRYQARYSLTAKAGVGPAHAPVLA